jgi:hypothetical protein
MKLNKNKDVWNLAFTAGICTGVWTTLIYLIAS